MHNNLSVHKVEYNGNRKVSNRSLWAQRSPYKYAALKELESTSKVRRERFMYSLEELEYLATLGLHSYIREQSTQSTIDLSWGASQLMGHETCPSQPPESPHTWCVCIV